MLELDAEQYHRYRSEVATWASLYLKDEPVRISIEDQDKILEAALMASIHDQRWVQ